jgi:uncharacterized delta-60 repeat protein
MNQLFRYGLLTAAAFLLFVLPVAGQDYSLDPTFNPSFSGRTHQFFDSNNALALQADQKILVGGNFTIVNGDPSPLIVRLNPNGTRDSFFNSPLGFEANDLVSLIKVQPDGKILVAGTFRVGGAVTYFVRLNADGSLDATFTPGSTGFIKSIDLYADGRILACGSLTTGKIARLFANGTVDASFAANITGNQCFDTEITPDGKIYAAGTITSLNGLGIPGIVRMNADGTKDDSFALPNVGFPQLSREFYRLALEPGGSLLAGLKTWAQDQQGELTASLSLFRFTPGGAVQSIPNCDAIEQSNELFVQADGKVITNMCRANSSSPAYWFGRLFQSGTFDSSLNRLSFNNPVYRVVRQADGNYVVIGGFSSVDGIPRQRIARLVNTQIAVRRRSDFDGDGKDDLAVFRPSDSYWYINQTSAGLNFTPWGLSTDRVIAADYDNDGKTDITVFRDGNWYTLRSSDNTLMYRFFGQAGDQPFVGDIDGDGRVDRLVRRQVAANSVQWQVSYFSNTGTASQTISNETIADRPVVGDFDGDNIDEIAYFRDGVWTARRFGSGAPERVYYWGTAGDVPTPGDFDHDGQIDIGVFRPSTGTWYINRSTFGYYAVQFGAAGDVPVVADYDGDGQSDIAVFRNGIWYQILSGNNSFRASSWGLAGDIPIPGQSN